MGFVALGIAARLARYVVDFPLWGDELLLTGNFLDRGFAELARPLDNHQVAPVLFLWIELAATKLFGLNEFALRLFPLLCGIGALLLFARLAWRLAPGLPSVLAVAIFACATYTIRHSTEVKPYATDACVSLVLLSLAEMWFRSPRRVAWLWTFAAFAPLAVALSYPAIFVIGGLSAAIAWQLARTRQRRGWAAFVAVNLVAAVSFLALLKAATGPQFAAEREVMQDYWRDAFPPVASPLRLPGWFVRIHAGEMFAYPAGGENGGGAPTFALFVVGLALFIKRGDRVVSVTTLAVLTLAFVAAALGRYPYGGHPRLMQYVAPLICLVAGYGAAGCLDAFGHPRLRRATIVVLLALAAGLGGVLMARDVTHPYRDEHERIWRETARRFWREQSRGAARVVLAPRELEGELFPKQGTGIHHLACRIYERIYRPASRSAVADGRPLRYVVYHNSTDRIDVERWDAWLREMTGRLELKGQFTSRSAEDVRWACERYEVFEFVARRQL